MNQETLRWPVDKGGYEFVEIEDYGDRYRPDIRWSVSAVAAHLDRLRAERGETVKPTLCIQPKVCKLAQVRPEEDGTVTVPELVRTYDPMKKRKLFRDFANLQEKPESILGFANRYGLLGLPQYEKLDILIHPDELEPLCAWYDEIRSMRRYVTMYYLAQRKDNEGLESFVPWMSKNYRPSGEFLGRPLEYSPYAQRRDQFKRSQFRGNIREAALWEVRSEVNRRLAQQASPALATSSRFSSESTGLVFIPHTLLAAMWLRFALQVAEMHVQAQCQNPRCQELFWLETAGDERNRTQRSDTKYCSNACRVAAHRVRKKQTVRAETGEKSH